ncbi:MAG: site-2 protease family protein [Elusimicrobia bacterium]|nr:site-2 protease family protein [Elusimicrobiota bacterium]
MKPKLSLSRLALAGALLLGSPAGQAFAGGTFRSFAGAPQILRMALPPMNGGADAGIAGGLGGLRELKFHLGSASLPFEPRLPLNTAPAPARLEAMARLAALSERRELRLSGSGGNITAEMLRGDSGRIFGEVHAEGSALAVGLEETAAAFPSGAPVWPERNSGSDFGPDAGMGGPREAGSGFIGFHDGGGLGGGYVGYGDESRNGGGAFFAMALLAAAPAVPGLEHLSHQDLGTALFFEASMAFSLILHEILHARLSRRLGDDQPVLDNRGSLNPKDWGTHINPWGTVILPMLFFSLMGWMLGVANPVEPEPRKFKDPIRDQAKAAVAGPLGNAGLAVLGAGVFAALTSLGGHVAAAYASLFTVVNVTLTLFNLVPFHPLDGSKVVGLLPPAIAGEILDFYSAGFLRWVPFYVLLAVMATTGIGGWMVLKSSALLLGLAGSTMGTGVLVALSAAALAGFWRVLR